MTTLYHGDVFWVDLSASKQCDNLRRCCQPLANVIWRGIEVALTSAQTPDTKAPDERECAQDKA